MSMKYQDLIAHEVSDIPGRSLVITDLVLLLQDFDASGLVLRGPGRVYSRLGTFVDVEGFVLRGLNSLADHGTRGPGGSYAVVLNFEVPIFRELERMGVVNISNSGMRGERVQDWSVVRGPGYDETKVVAVQKPRIRVGSLFEIGRERYIPLR